MRGAGLARFQRESGNCKRFRASFCHYFVIIDSEVFYEENCICMFGQYLPQSDGRVCHEEFNRPTENREPGNLKLGARQSHSSGDTGYF
jgi:hypothetical protein